MTRAWEGRGRCQGLLRAESVETGLQGNSREVGGGTGDAEKAGGTEADRQPD